MVQMKEEVSDLRGKFKNNCRIKEYSTHSSKIHSVDWNCDGRRLASGGFDKSVCIVGLSNDRLSKEVCSWQLWIAMRNSEKITWNHFDHWNLTSYSDNLSRAWRLCWPACLASFWSWYARHCIRRSNCKNLGRKSI